MMDDIIKYTRGVWLLEKSIWGDDVRSNPCFATFVPAFSLLAGAMLGAGGWVLDFLPFLAGLNAAPFAVLLVILAGLVLCESVCVAKGFEVIFLRTLLVFVLAAVAGFAGYLMGGIALLPAVVWLFLLFVDILCHLFK